MKKLIIGFLFAFVFLFSAALAQTNPAHITGGKFFITGNQDIQNARIETANFTAIGSLGGFTSPWWLICLDPVCRPGTNLNIPALVISVGGCVGDCNQFVYGAFTINGVTYQNAFYRGHFNFSQATFQIPKIARRKGLVSLRTPFTFDGHLQVCQVSDINQYCPVDKILFNGDIKGSGTLTVTGQIKVYNSGEYFIPYLQRKNIEYQFEP